MIRTRTALAFLLLASCQANEVTVGELQEVMILPAMPNPNIDILFVIDNSTSMLDKQQSLRESFPRMMDELESLDGGLPNVHIGVITTDLGTSASNNAVGPTIGSGPGSCSGRGEAGVLRRDVVPSLGTAAFISDIANSDGSRSRNYTGDLGDVFSALAQVDANGCGFEQPLLAIRQALQSPANAGFLRPEANLAIVIVADEDDCSMADTGLLTSEVDQLGALQSFRCTRFGVTCDGGGATPDAMNMVGMKNGCRVNTASTLLDDVTPYVDFLVNLKGDPNAVMVSAIVGAPTVAVELRQPPGGGTSIPAVAHSCTYGGRNGPEVADPAVRLAEFVAGFPSRSALTSICSPTLATPLSTIGRAATRMMGDPCIGTALVDTDTSPGIQPRCEVVDGSPGAETQIPECAENQTGSCWSLVLDTAKCAGIADNLRLQITRPSMPTTQLYSHLRCLTR